MAIGLTTVWFEIGRPLRALNVYINLRQSWMTREAYVAGAAFALGAAAWWTTLAWLAVATGALAAVFVYCQARMLRRCVGIPAWREPALVAFMLATSLVEGVALALLVVAATPASVAWVLALVAAIALRYAAWHRYRARVERNLVARARRAIGSAHTVIWVAGTVIPVLLAGAVAWPVVQTIPLVAAALLALVAGGFTKWIVLTRADHNQGFSLPQLPVRGVRMKAQGEGR